MNLFIDIETTSLIPKGADWKTDYNEFPYILSIGMSGFLRTIADKYEYLIWDYEYEGMEMDGALSINSLSKKRLRENGLSFKATMKVFIFFALEQADYVIGYNIYFDSSIIKANVLRYFGPDSKEAQLIEEALHKDKRIDVMKMVQKRFGGKYMKLTDAYEKLFGKTYPAHNALQDVIATERIYNELT